MLDTSQSSFILRFFVELIAIMNPISSAAIYLSMTKSADKAMRYKVALVCAISVLAVLMLTGLLGLAMLDLFGVSMGALRLAGGAVVFVIGYRMLMGNSNDNNVEASKKVTLGMGVIPLAIPLSSGAGAMATVIAYSSLLTSGQAPFGFLGVCVAVAVVLLLTFLIMAAFAHKISANALQVVTSIMGLITASIAVELIRTGIYELFPMITQSC